MVFRTTSKKLEKSGQETVRGIAVKRLPRITHKLGAPRLYACTRLYPLRNNQRRIWGRCEALPKPYTNPSIKGKTSLTH